jgi:hypothetical protein
VEKVPSEGGWKMLSVAGLLGLTSWYTLENQFSNVVISLVHNVVISLLQYISDLLKMSHLSNGKVK